MLTIYCPNRHPVQVPARSGVVTGEHYQIETRCADDEWQACPICGPFLHYPDGSAKPVPPSPCNIGPSNP